MIGLPGATARPRRSSRSITALAKTATRRRADSNRERTPSAKSNCIRSSLFRNAGDWLVRAPEVSAAEGAERLVTATSPERLTTMGADTVAINAAFS
jgi:hypothetical protein